jgi:hypothetical protein
MERQRANQKTTKAVVVRYMKEKKLSSGETTHNIIKQLINEHRLNMEVINSQVHFLTINYENEFNKIYNFLLEIEQIIDGIGETQSKVSKRYLAIADDKPDKEFVKMAYYLNAVFFKPYKDTVDIILQELLAITNEKIDYEKDSQILYKKISELLRKMTLQNWYPPGMGPIKQLDYQSHTLGHVKPTPVTEANKINLDLAKELITTIEKFKKEFLT